MKGGRGKVKPEEKMGKRITKEEEDSEDGGKDR